MCREGDKADRMRGVWAEVLLCSFGEARVALSEEPLGEEMKKGTKQEQMKNLQERRKLTSIRCTSCSASRA
jgi:hypothetical protein